MHKNEEEFKAWYHGILAVASLAEVFTAKTTLRKVLLVLASGWHARCTWEHIQEVQKDNALFEGIERWKNTPRHFEYQEFPKEAFTFPNKPIIPRKTVVFDEGTVWCHVPEVTNISFDKEYPHELRQGVPKPEGQTEALPKETTEGKPLVPTGRFVHVVQEEPKVFRDKVVTRRLKRTTE